MTDKQYDLTAVSLQLGKLVDPEVHALVQRARENGVDLHPDDIDTSTGTHLIKGKPAEEWVETRIRLRPEALALLKRARENEIALKADDIKINGGVLTIDGMTAHEWLDAMTEE